jgi:hypothetical protein
MPVPTLGGQTQTELETKWIAPEGGRYQLAAKVELPPQAVETSIYNNLLLAVVRVSGDFAPEIEVGKVEFDRTPLVPGESYTAAVKVRNPSFTELRDLWVYIAINDRYLSGGAIESAGAESLLIESAAGNYSSDRVPFLIIPLLSPGEIRTVVFPWIDLSSGQNLLRVEFGNLPGEFPEGQKLASEEITVSGPTGDPGPWLNRWYYMGPSVIENTSSTGRMDVLANLIRNTHLCVTQFFSFDVSQTNPDLIAGGTQDVGTILYEGNPGWREIKGGDGYFTLIAPSGDEVMYAQHQFLKSTARTDDQGADGWPNRVESELTENDGYAETAFITVSPFDCNLVLAQGEEVKASGDGGRYWENVGPSAAFNPGKRGKIHRIAFQPDTAHIFAGTTENGQIWLSSNYLYPGFVWERLYSHPDPTAYVVNMAFDSKNSRVLYVLYGGCDNSRRIARFEEDEPGNWQRTWITGNFPTADKNIGWYCIAGDPSRDEFVYVGTQRGVYQGYLDSATNVWKWAPFNNDLPLTDVKDLISIPKTYELRAFTWGRGIWQVFPDFSGE